MIWGLQRKKKGVIRAIKLEKEKKYPSELKISRLEDANRSYSRKIRKIKSERG